MLLEGGAEDGRLEEVIPAGTHVGGRSGRLKHDQIISSQPLLIKRECQPISLRKHPGEGSKLFKRFFFKYVG